MGAQLNQCHCGYTGALAGISHQSVYFSLQCPECNREVTAFTLDGLVENWNKPQPAAPGADIACSKEWV